MKNEKQTKDHCEIRRAYTNKYGDKQLSIAIEIQNEKKLKKIKALIIKREKDNFTIQKIVG